MHFLALGTPSGPGGAADLRQLHAAIDTLAPLLTEPTLVVGKSTVPVGTAPELEERLRDRPRPAMASRSPGTRSSCARRTPSRTRCAPTGSSSAPLRARAGGLERSTRSDQRRTPACPLRHRHRRADQGRGELVPRHQDQLHQRDGQMCQAAGGDVTLLADAIGYDKRIGREFLNAGLGFGGGCLPKDIAALAVRADELGVTVLTDFIHSVEAINAGQRNELADLDDRPGRRGRQRQADRRPRRGLQAGHRRHPQLPRADRGRSAPRARGRRPDLRPAGAAPSAGGLHPGRQRRAGAARCGGGAAPDRVAGVPPAQSGEASASWSSRRSSSTAG